MTQMLASVGNPGEAEIAVVEGADIIDLKDPSTERLAAVDLSIVKATLAQVAGRRRVSAVCDAPATAQGCLASAAATMAETGVDFVKLGLYPSDHLAADIAALREVAARTRLIAVFFADLGVDFDILPSLAAAGFAGAMIDTAAKGKLRLIDHMNIAALDRFVLACRQHKLTLGMAGGLEAPDVSRLLLLEPDVLGFRGALCADNNRAGGIIASNVRMIRDLIPRADAPHDFSEDVKVDWRFLAARGYSVLDDAKPATDRIFMRDLVLPVSIGTYSHERDAVQKVRFNVDADVRRSSRQAEDMRDIFSYDVIVDAIRLIVSRGHVPLVEALAEQIADAVLVHPRVVGVTVRVEKLDVIEGRLGVEITRTRAAQPAQMQRLSPLPADIGARKTGI